MRVIGEGEKRKSIERIFEEMITVNITNLLKDMNINI
jgi:hypothetical protein